MSVDAVRSTLFDWGAHMLLKSAAAAGIAAVVVVYGLATANAGTPLMKGNWLVTACDDLDRTTCTTSCFVFTKTPGQFAGTWLSQDADAFAGNWNQRADRVTVWGLSHVGGDTAIYFKGAFSTAKQLNGSRFIAFTVPNDNIRIGNWHAKRVAACPS